MNQAVRKHTIHLLLTCTMTCSFIAGAHTQSATYFINQKDADTEASNLPSKTTIQSSDLLSIDVPSMSVQPTNSWNLASLASSNADYCPRANSRQQGGYRVDHDGHIKLLYTGKIKATALSNKEKTAKREQGGLT